MITVSFIKRKELDCRYSRTEKTININNILFYRYSYCVNKETTHRKISEASAFPGRLQCSFLAFRWPAELAYASPFLELDLTSKQRINA